MAINRTVIIVFDSLGLGELPDAVKYGDSGSNTLANTAKAVGGLDIPNLARLGLGNIIKVTGVEPAIEPQAAYGKMAEVSAGKDTTVGHWELAGLWSLKPFPVYPNGFPERLITDFYHRTGLKVLGNKAASGTEIIAELGEEHEHTGYPIVYTSADSVWQIAAHDDVIALQSLYELCTIAREMLTGDDGVARVIARPFTGRPGAYTRTHWRKDFSIVPPAPTLLDYALKQKTPVLAAGKISEIFAGRGITKSRHTSSNDDTFNLILDYLAEDKRSIIFANLVDFDTLWGHRNDPAGYAGGLEAADKRLVQITDKLKPDDLLVIVGDHGCDPTTSSTDHSREYVPLLIYGDQVKSGHNIGTRSTFSDAAQTIASAMGLEVDLKGESLWETIT